MKRKYAGIGARTTPAPILRAMNQLSMILDRKGFLLRSGGAGGADTAFEKFSNYKEIFRAGDATSDSEKQAMKYHPNPMAIKKDYVKKLLGRNLMVVSGKYLDDPVDFIVCWTPKGEIVGGTGHTIRYAKSLGIKVYNLAIKEDIKDLKEMIKEL